MRLRTLLLLSVFGAAVATAQFPGMPRRGSGGAASVSTSSVATLDTITYQDIEQFLGPLNYCILTDGSATFVQGGIEDPFIQHDTYAAGLLAATDQYTSWVRMVAPVSTPTVPNTGFRDSSGSQLGSMAYKGGMGWGLDGWAFFAQWGIQPGTAEARHSYFVGMRTNSDGGMNRRKPNALFDSVYIGCHQGDTAQSVCTNGVDDAGATCVYLGLADGGGDFPCNRTFVGNVLFKMNRGGTSLQYATQNISANAVKRGTLSTNLPRPQALLGWEISQLTDAGGTGSEIAFSRVCVGVDP